MLEKKCTTHNLNTFGRAHYSYINQIFGDITIRDIIQEIMSKKGFNGKFVVENSGQEFENSYHHLFITDNNLRICSVKMGYQDLDVDINDTLCQSYSLMSYLEIPFNSTPSKDATIEMKFDKQLSMINMYRNIISIPEFRKEFKMIITNKENNKLWIDIIDENNEFYIIEKYKSAAPILNNISHILNIWEAYGWQYFVGKGIKVKTKTQASFPK
jgi:hypothetical protein